MRYQTSRMAGLLLQRIVKSLSAQPLRHISRQFKYTASTLSEEGSKGLKAYDSGVQSVETSFPDHSGYSAQEQTNSAGMWTRLARKEEFVLRHALFV